MIQYVVDAFTDQVFQGNPAAVCVMDAWIPDALMQKIAMENNLSETAFTVKEGERYRLRWFTPGGELELVGHATLACAYVIMNFLEKGKEHVSFDTLSGELTVQKYGDLYEMNFPAYELTPVEVTQEMTDAIGATPIEAYMGRDLLCVLQDEDTVKNLTPNLDKVIHLDGLLLQVTAKGSETDCVSRTFAPKMKVPEDPVCGSGHCHIAPYWIQKLQKDEIVAYQASPRGGTLYCKLDGDRVVMSGKAALYSIADIFVR